MVEKNIRSRIIQSSFWNSSAGVINRIGSLVFTIILARMLMPERYGLYSLVFSVAMVFYTFADLGINQALVRYISYSLTHDKKNVNGYYLFLFRVKFLISLVAAAM